MKQLNDYMNLFLHFRLEYKQMSYQSKGAINEMLPEIFKEFLPEVNHCSNESESKQHRRVKCSAPEPGASSVSLALHRGN